MPIKVRAHPYAFGVGAALLLYIFLAYIYQAPLLNNGDYHRITHQLIQIPAYVGLDQTCFEIQPGAFFIPTSLASLIFELNVAFIKLLGYSCWTMKSYFFMLAAVYLIGLYRCFVSHLPLIAIAGLIVAPVFFSPFLKSLYEEGIILTLLPWVTLSIHLLRTNGKILAFTIASTLLVMAKTQLVLLVPAMLYAVLVYGKATKLSSLKIAGACTILAFAVMGSLYQKQKQEDGLANSYNRLFNGIGWSMQAVHTWPTNRFSERLQYFSSNQSTLQEITKHIELIPNLDLWGTSYWPTGLELLVSGNDPRWQSIEQHLNPKFFLKFLYSHPDVMAQYLQNGVLVFVTSNYAFGVLQEIAPSTIGVGLAAMSSYSFQSVIWIYALLLIYFLITRKSTGRVLGIAIFMGAPFAVLLGDGFFEFEKHLMPFWITLPLLPLLVPSDQFHRTNH